MRVGVDMRAVYQLRRRGTGKNLLDLYTTLARMQPDWRFVMFHRGRSGDDPFEQFENVESCKIDISGDRLNLWQQIRLPLAARWAGVDVLHCPANRAPRWPIVPMVVTIHDLIPLDSDTGDKAASRWWRNVTRAAKNARRIITPSQFTRENIVNRLHVQSDKVVVNHWAPDRGCQRVTDADRLARIRSQYGLDAGRPYVFGFGAADPRKNTRGILMAWAKLPGAMRQAYQLLLVGIDETAMEPLRTQVQRLGIADSCVLAGFADEADLPVIVSGATAMCYPSLSEGFGLPILDAFVCRTAVLTSSTTSLPEVAGDAAVLVAPDDPAAIADGLMRLLDDEALRAHLVARGAERVETFTWPACGRRVSAVLEEAVTEN